MLIYALSLCFSYFMDIIYLYLKLVLNQICHGSNELDDALESQ